MRFFSFILVAVLLSFSSCSEKVDVTEVSDSNSNDVVVVPGEGPVWVTYQFENLENGNVAVQFNTRIEKKWHVYANILSDDEEAIGPYPSEFLVDDNNDVKFLQEVREIGKKINHFDPNFEMNLNYYEDKASFIQEMEVLNKGDFELVAMFSYMMCDDSKCMFPDPIEFKLVFKNGKAVKIGPKDLEINEEIFKILPKTDGVDLSNPLTDCGEQKEEKRGYWLLFFLGLGGGLISLLTPCVFPMIPLTVSFFTKGGNETGKGVGKALIYGISIVAVYVLCSLPFYLGSDPEVLNRISTGFTLNIIFFAIFVIFALSFFGYFEIGLPASWANKADKAADIGGILGIVFMAVVLAIVSFSCTGPLLGSVLASSLKDGPVPITMAMLGFGLGLGLPFTIFAAFPSLLKSLPKSGGWLNTVKVVLGFVELGLAVKFLSNADFVYRMGIIHRETFFLIWIIISLATFCYLMGWIRFPHDSKNAKIGSTRKVIGLVFLVFGLYLIPGVMPVEKQPYRFNLIAGFPPSTWYSWYEQEEEFHIYHDYDNALAAAKSENKMLLIDFTGYACVNCRKMEENVWVDTDVKKILQDSVVILSLYVDDKVDLPIELQGDVLISGPDGVEKPKKIKTVGDKWATFQSTRFESVSQPFYVLMDGNGSLLSHPRGYTPDEVEYKEWLECSMKGLKRKDF